MVRFTVLLLTFALIVAAVLLGRGCWQSYTGVRDHTRRAMLWGASNVALGGGVFVAAYGIVPAAEIFICTTAALALASASLVIYCDVRAREMRSRKQSNPATALPLVSHEKTGPMQRE